MSSISKINLSDTDYTLNASSISDYNSSTAKIQVGFAGAGLTASTLGYVAGYTTDGTKIKDVNKAQMKSWLGLGSAAYANLATVFNRHLYPSLGSTQTGNTPVWLLGLKGAGYPVYSDPEFASGTTVEKYANSGSENLTVTRGLATDFGIIDSGNSSGYVIQIKNTGTVVPGLGGFYLNPFSRANAIFIQIFRAMIPSGYSVQVASNPMGTSYQDTWLTSNAGTGKWEWYVRSIHCGSTGSFSSGGHVYLTGTTGTTDNPVIWYLSYCNCIDITKGNYDGLRTRFSDKLSTARNLKIGNTSKSFDGSSDISWSLSEIGCLPLSGGTMSGDIRFNYNYGITLNTGTSWDDGFRSIPFSNVSDPSKIQWYSTNATTGLTFNAKSGTLKTGELITSGSTTSSKFIKSGGTSSQFLKADGSVDSNSYSTTSHTHSYLPLSGGTITNSNFAPLSIQRSGSTYAAAIKFENSNGTLGYLGITGSANSSLKRWENDANTPHTICDDSNTYISSGTVYINGNSIKPVTSETSLSKGTTSGSGNAVTDISVSGHKITLTKDTTFLTAHQDISGKSNTSHTHSVKINGTTKTIAASGGTAVDLGTYLTAHQDISGKQDKSTAVTHTASTAVGSSTRPVYITSDGKATAIGYTIAKSVPSNAVFTDTNQTVKGNGTGFGSTAAIDIVGSGATTVTADTTNNQITISSTNTVYSLPTASSSTLGGIKVGSNLSIDSNGVLSGTANTTYSAGTGLTLSGTSFSLNAATSSTLGGIKTGYTTSGKNYKVQLDSNNNAYVNVPWTDTYTQYPYGFSSRLISSWGNQTGTVITDWHTASGGDVQWMNDNPVSGQVSLKVDGTVYINEGKDAVASQAWVNNKGYTTNTGTVTSVAVKMNGASKGTVTTSGTIDLGTVLTDDSTYFKQQRTSTKSIYDYVNDGTGDTFIASLPNGTYSIPYTFYDSSGNLQSSHSELLVRLALNAGSASALEFWTNYGNDSALKYRKTIDNNRISGAWKTIANTDYVDSSIKSHTHDDRYYTESETDSKLSAKQDKSTAVTHTASTAVGSSTQPVYIASDGKATAIGYTIAKSVPSNAVFTDTNQTVKCNGTGFGSTAAIDIVGSGATTVTADTTNNQITISSTNTVYSLPTASSSTLGGIKVGSNLSIDSNGVLSGTANTTYSAGTGLTLSGTTFSLNAAGSALGGVKTTSTVNSNSGYTACPIIGGVPYYKDTNTTYNFIGSTFYSYNSNNKQDCDNCTTNGVYYYISNGPSGITAGDGALYTQAHSTSWVGQIAQDYRSGHLFLRGKNNGKWTDWLTNCDSSNTYISSGTVYINGNSIKPVTSETSLSKGTTSGSGNAVTDISVSGHKITLTKDTTFLTAHQDISGKSDTSHTHSVKINGTTKTIAASGGTAVDLGTYLTAHQDISGKADKASITAGTAGTSSATSGSWLSVPYVTMNAQGIVTGYGTHKHTISGFAASSHTHSYLPLSGGVMTGSIHSTFTSNLWVNSLTDSVITLDHAGYSGWICGPTKDGRISISTYADSTGGTNNLYFGWGETGRTENSFASQMLWDGANNVLYAGTFKRIGGAEVSYEGHTHSQYLTSIPIASSSTLGGIKVGSNLSISSDGTLSGTANTTYSTFTGASASAAGTSGLVPAPAAGKNTSFLRGDGTWVVPTDTNTHYASSTIVSNAATGTANASTSISNGKVYLNHIENGAVKSSHLIKGSGATTVTANSSNQIIISSTNTTYSASGLNKLSGTTMYGNGVIPAIFMSPLTAVNACLCEHLVQMINYGVIEASYGDTLCTDLYLYMASISDNGGTCAIKAINASSSTALASLLCTITNHLNVLYGNGAIRPRTFTIHFYLYSASTNTQRIPVLIGCNDESETIDLSNVKIFTGITEWLPGYYQIKFMYSDSRTAYFVNTVNTKSSLESGGCLGAESPSRLWQIHISRFM